MMSVLGVCVGIFFVFGFLEPVLLFLGLKLCHPSANLQLIQTSEALKEIIFMCLYWFDIIVIHMGLDL